MDCMLATAQQTDVYTYGTLLLEKQSKNWEVIQVQSIKCVWVSKIGWLHAATIKQLLCPNSLRYFCDVHLNLIWLSQLNCVDVLGFIIIMMIGTRLFYNFAIYFSKSL